MKYTYTLFPLFIMNPAVSQISEDGDVYRFTLSGLNVSLANAIRRTILSDIPITVIETDTAETNKCTILTNTGRLHNEILKHRLSCIPIHETDLQRLPGKYVLEVDVKNDTDSMRYVTTEDFRVRSKEGSQEYLTPEQTRVLFPPNPKTNYYIDFARLRPKLGDDIPGEQLTLRAEFSLGTAKMNSMYNVVSNCSYGNTPDQAKIAEIWEEREAKLRSEDVSSEDIAFQKRDYYLLDAQRQFVPDSYDFVLRTIGIYENRELVQKACAVLQNKFIDIIQALDSEVVPIFASETTMDHCYDVLLEDEDYTVGKVIEYVLYEKHYMGDKVLSFCGFKKFHPHNTEATIRLAFQKKSDTSLVRQYLREACIDAQDVFKTIYHMFAK